MNGVHKLPHPKFGTPHLLRQPFGFWMFSCFLGCLRNFLALTTIVFLFGGALAPTRILFEKEVRPYGLQKGPKTTRERGRKKKEKKKK
jgi:hypothetical protein